MQTDEPRQKDKIQVEIVWDCHEKEIGRICVMKRVRQWSLREQFAIDFVFQREKEREQPISTIHDRHQTSRLHSGRLRWIMASEA